MPLLSSFTLTTILAVYCLFCLAVLYFCMLADPATSQLAKLLQNDLPQKCWTVGTKAIGKEKMSFFHNFMDRFLMLMYFTVVGGSWSVVFGYLYPWLWHEASDDVWQGHGILGVGVFLACFGSWAVANTSHPGKITAKNFARYDHYPYDGLLFPSNLPRCETTHLPKIPRSKFDRIKYHCRVPRYDHFCGWTYNTYGENNYRYFLGFLAQHVIMCAYGSYVCALLFADEIRQRKLLELTFFDRATGETVPATKWIIFQYMFARRTLECCLFVLMAVMGVALAAFLGYHIYLTTVGQTTNENAKWGDIRDWHKRQLQKYKRAVEDGKIKPPSSSPSTAAKTKDVSSIETPTSSLDADENDVTCTGAGKNKLQSTQGNSQHPDFFDPGPMPKNMYNRGWKENWKEVLWPMPKRKNAVAMGGYTKQQPTPQQQQPPTTQQVRPAIARQKPKAI